MPRASVVAGATVAIASIATVVLVSGVFVRADDHGSRASASARASRCAGSPAGAPCGRDVQVRDAGHGPGSPTSITIPAIGLHAEIAGVVSTHDHGRWTIDPPKQTLGELQRVYWWSEHAAPADPSTGSAYLYAHSCMSLVCAFNDLPKVSAGDVVRVASPRGALSYRVVAEPRKLAKTAGGIGSSSIYDYDVPDRLVLITCGYTPDGSSPFNWVVIARLRGAIRDR